METIMDLIRQKKEQFRKPKMVTLDPSQGCARFATI